MNAWLVIIAIVGGYALLRLDYARRNRLLLDDPGLRQSGRIALPVGEKHLTGKCLFRQLVVAEFLPAKITNRQAAAEVEEQSSLIERPLVNLANGRVGCRASWLPNAVQ